MIACSGVASPAASSANPAAGWRPNDRADWPWVSTSTSSTRCPASASPAARFTAVVVFPTPPLVSAMAILRIIRLLPDGSCPCDLGERVALAVVAEPDERVALLPLDHDRHHDRQHPVDGPLHLQRLRRDEE